ncbi:hypothetical protein [Laspinema olomoucense]|uniref:hypothetical protein n=1 Tax=Laspinema olomoucense TaxID=3231600 RepID=UPI0021BA844C|nr:MULTISPECIES: hypothetical protein [unclassified Laspinema]MCT7971103.1 hypothetical protein [Laspinema sp. D3d]MCT7987630.1 hypothetical protein [Laspinema sp. D3a]
MSQERREEFESLKHIPNKEYIFGSAMIMQALMLAIAEIRSISLLLPLSTMSKRQLRRHFIKKAGETIRNMNEEQFLAFINEHFSSDDFEERET